MKIESDDFSSRDVGNALIQTHSIISVVIASGTDFK